jgi:hypothetical protein
MKLLKRLHSVFTDNSGLVCLNWNPEGGPWKKQKKKNLRNMKNY